MYLPSPEQMKAAENAAVREGTTLLELMERAGLALADEVQAFHEKKGGRVLILCGKGNNGGDGFVCARILAQRGIAVSVALVFPPQSEGIAAEEYKRLADVRSVNIFTPCKPYDKTLSDYSTVVDAVFGTGFHGEPSCDIAELFDAVNESTAVVVAADVPSGLNCADGTASAHSLKCVKTVTFGSPKIGMMTKVGNALCGEIAVHTIGITDSCFEQVGNVPVMLTGDRVRELIPDREEQSHKGSFGKLLVIAGSESMSGAAALNVKAALRSGAGLVRLASVPKVIDRVGASIHECTFVELQSEDGAISSASIAAIKSALKKSTVAAIGSGISTAKTAKETVLAVIKICGEENIPLIIDADGLNAVTDCIDIIRKANCTAILTPHIGELARLMGTDTEYAAKNRLQCAVRLSEMTGAVVVAKGVPTFITDGKRTAASFTGNPGLARGGSGDVLTGTISGLCAFLGKNPDLWKAAAAGVFTFGLSADIAAERLFEQGMLPSDAADMLPYAFKEVLK
ncbi:MAG: NAD(P)H-hydrate dehydratase [Oscillospiraceae bacterium]|nr:NAD(P)H-hydrate dehydratase [Oscillospiraceae bacterium]